MSSGEEAAAKGAPATVAKDPLADCPMPRFIELKPVKHGILIKEGHQFRTWKKRICVLEGRYLYYYVSEDDKAPRGVLSLDNCQVEEQPQLGRDRKSFCFSVVSERSWNVQSKRMFTNRRYYFTLTSFQELNDWMAVIGAVSSDCPGLMRGDPM